MTSTVRIYRYDDASAPQLSGTVGSLTTLLRACLVGSGGVAYGSKPSAGWTEQFVGAASNIAVFRNNQAEGFSGCYVRIHDNAPGTAGAREAYLNVYSAMTDVNTGSNGTRTYYVRKSSALSTTARNWMLIVDGGTAWLYIWATGDATTFGWDGNVILFGDYDCVVGTGAFRYCATGRTSENYGAGSGMNFAQVPTSINPPTNAFQVAPLNGIGAAVDADMVLPSLGATSTTDSVGGAGWPASPDAAGNRRFIAAPLVRISKACAGRLRGIHIPLEQLYTLTRGDLVPGSSSLRVLSGNYGGNSTNNNFAAVAVDSVGPW